jgi:2-dehydrotetronate isomerase
MPRFSANLGFLWPDRPLLQRIESAAQAGFEAAELHWPYDVPPEEVRDACRLHNVRLLGINSPLGDTMQGDFGLAALPGRERDFEVSFDVAMDYARRSGASAIHVMAGLVGPEACVEAKAVFRRNLVRAAERAGDLTLLLEALNTRNNPGYFYSRIEDVAALIGATQCSNVKMMFDVYHVGVEQGDILTRLERYLPLIGHIQIAAVPSRTEPNEGEINYAWILSEIDRLGYTAWVGCEYKPRGETDDGLQSWAHLRTLHSNAR